MSNNPLYIITGMLVLILVGCGDNGSVPVSEIEPGTGELEVVFAANPEGDSVTILDSSELGDSIDRRFGDENNEAINITPDDSIGDVLDRADNG